MDEGAAAYEIEPPEGNEASSRDPTLDLAIGLFQEGQYSHARKVLARLQHTRPKDARVWYYAALANGLTTNVWDGETKMLVDRGIERERAGTPIKAQIAASLAGVSPQAGKEWLEQQRREAQKQDDTDDAPNE